MGFVTGILCVWLVAREHVWNWPVSIANVTFLGLVFLAAGLYADATLQVIYVILSVYGWWHWLYGGAERTRLLVTRTPPGEWVAQTLAGVVATPVLAYGLVALTDSTVPFLDALTTTLSLVATYGQSRKRLESWWIWIAADLIYIPLYAYKGLALTAALYVVFLGLCLVGLRHWSRAAAGTAGAAA